MQQVVHESFGNHLFSLKICGLHPINYSEHRIYRIYCWILYVLLDILFPIWILTSTILKKKNGNMVQLVDDIFACIQQGITPFKLLPFLIDAQVIYPFLKKVEQKSFVPSLADDKKVISNCIAACRMIFKALTYAGLASWACWSLKPFYMEDKIVPIEILLPFEFKRDSYLYWPIFIYMVLSIAHGCVSHAAIDTLIVGLTYHASTQLQIFKNNLQRLSRKANVQTDNIQNEQERERVRHQIIFAELKKCARHYDDIQQFVAELENIFSITPFSQLLASSIVICATCFQIITVKLTSFTFLALCVYMSALLFQVCLYCTYGDKLYEESSTILDAIYMSEWYTFDTRCKKIIIIMMQRAQKPMIFRAGKILALSMNTLTLIIKRAYSLLALLRHYM